MNTIPQTNIDKAKASHLQSMNEAEEENEPIVREYHRKALAYITLTM